jgi:hypothetical protein
MWNHASKVSVIFFCYDMTVNEAHTEALCSLIVSVLQCLLRNLTSHLIILLATVGGTSSPGLQVVPSGGTANKHRETQLQLQRKLQEREVIREQKRKLQVKILLCHIYPK